MTGVQTCALPICQGNEQQTLNILVKADVQGSVQALRESLSAIGNDNVKVNVIAAGVGGITESDATLAAASKALVIGFNVRADASARKVIDTAGLDVRYFSIIYDVIDQVKQAASGLLGVEIREEIIGIAQVWARGYAIDCGCFGGGGDVDPEGRHVRYTVEILRDFLFMALAVRLARNPSTPFSLIPESPRAEKVQ